VTLARIRSFFSDTPYLSSAKEADSSKKPIHAQALKSVKPKTARIGSPVGFRFLRGRWCQKASASCRLDAGLHVLRWPLPHHVAPRLPQVSGRRRGDTRPHLGPIRVEIRCARSRHTRHCRTADRGSPPMGVAPTAVDAAAAGIGAVRCHAPPAALAAVARVRVGGLRHGHTRGRGAPPRARVPAPRPPPPGVSRPATRPREPSAPPPPRRGRCGRRALRQRPSRPAVPPARPTRRRHARGQRGRSAAAAPPRLLSGTHAPRR